MYKLLLDNDTSVTPSETAKQGNVQLAALTLKTVF